MSTTKALSSYLLPTNPPVFMCQRCLAVRVSSNEHICDTCCNVQNNLLLLQKDRDEAKAALRKVLIGIIVLLAIVAVLYFGG